MKLHTFLFLRRHERIKYGHYQETDIGDAAYNDHGFPKNGIRGFKKYGGLLVDHTDVQVNEHEGDQRSQYNDKGLDGKDTHLLFITCKMDQGDDGKAQLKTEDDLAENQQAVDIVFTIDQDHGNGWHNGDQAGDQSSHPWGDAQVEVSFHDDLSRQGPGDGRALS